MSSTDNFFSGGGTYANRMQAIEQQMTQLNAMFIGQEISLPPKTVNANSGLIEKNGTELSRTTYAALWAWLQLHPENLTSEFNYSSIVISSPISSCSLYSTGNGSTTFRVPTVGGGGFSRSANGSESDLDQGFQDQIQNITGSFVGINKIPDMDLGAISFGSGLTSGGYSSGTSGTNLYFDASRVVRTGTETHPQGFYNKTYIYTGNIVSNL